MAVTKAELFERSAGSQVRVHRRLVRKALMHAEPTPRKTPGNPHIRADRGNHFGAWQEPTLFTTEVRAAFRSLR